MTTVSFDLTKAHICLQRQCIISKGPVATGAFGPCYVFKGTAKEHNIVVHIDAGTNIKGLSEIFEVLKGLNISKEDLSNLHLMGGWKEDKVSNDTGVKVVSWLKEEGLLSKVNFDFFQKKAPPKSAPIKEEELSNYQYNGAVFFPDGKFQTFSKPWMKIEKMEAKARTQEEEKWRKKAEEEKQSFQLVMAKDLMKGMPVSIKIL